MGGAKQAQHMKVKIIFRAYFSSETPTEKNWHLKKNDNFQKNKNKKVFRKTTSEVDKQFISFHIEYELEMYLQNCRR